MGAEVRCSARSLWRFGGLSFASRDGRLLKSTVAIPKPMVLIGIGTHGYIISCGGGLRLCSGSRMRAASGSRNHPGSTVHIEHRGSMDGPHNWRMCRPHSAQSNSMSALSIVISTRQSGVLTEMQLVSPTIFRRFLHLSSDTGSLIGTTILLTATGGRLLGLRTSLRLHTFYPGKPAAVLVVRPQKPIRHGGVGAPPI